MPSERTKELVARFESAAANEAIATHVDEPSPETIRNLDAAEAALLSHYAEIEKGWTKTLARCFRLEERIAKMQAVLETAHVTLSSIHDLVRGREREPDKAYPIAFGEFAATLLDEIEQQSDEAITAIQHAALDALPSTEDRTSCPQCFMFGGHWPDCPDNPTRPK